MMHSKKHTELERSAKPSTAERVATPVEHRMKRMHERAVRTIAEEMAASLNAAVRAGKPIR